MLFRDLPIADSRVRMSSISDHVGDDEGHNHSEEQDEACGRRGTDRDFQDRGSRRWVVSGSLALIADAGQCLPVSLFDRFQSGHGAVNLDQHHVSRCHPDILKAPQNHNEFLRPG